MATRYSKETPALFILEDAIYYAFDEDNDPFVAEERAYWADKLQKAETLLSLIGDYDGACAAAEDKAKQLRRHKDKLLSFVEPGSEKRKSAEQRVKKAEAELVGANDAVAALADKICSHSPGFPTVDQARKAAQQQQRTASDFDIRKKSQRKDLHRRARSVECGQAGPLPYNKNRELCLWLLGINTYASRFLREAKSSDVKGKGDVEATLPSVLGRTFGADTPACLYTISPAKAKLDPALSKLHSNGKKKEVGDLFLSNCLPRLGQGTLGKAPSRDSVNTSELQKSGAGKRIVAEDQFYAELEQAPHACDELEWRLRCLKRMLPIFIMTSANPLYDLPLWDNKELCERMAEWMDEYAFGTGSAYKTVVLQAAYRYQSAPAESQHPQMGGEASVRERYEHFYGKASLESESLTSTSSWHAFPEKVRAKAELIYDTLVCAALSSTEYLLPSEATVPTRLFQRERNGESLHLDHASLALEPGSSAILIVDTLGQRGQHASDVLCTLDLSADAWRDIVFCRSFDANTKNKLSGDAACAQTMYPLCVFTSPFWHGESGSLDSRLHARITAPARDAGTSPAPLCLVDEGSKNGSSVVRDGVHYVVGAGADGKRLGEEAALASKLGHAEGVVDRTGSPFALKRGDRIYLAIDLSSEFTPSYVVL